MPYYLYQVSYTAAATKTLVEHPQNREDAAKSLIELLGGKLHSFFFAFGDYDLVLIAQMPDNLAAGAVSLAAASGGAFAKFHTTPLLTTGDSIKIMKQAQKAVYAPPK